jgi:hypothetical protein
MRSSFAVIGLTLPLDLLVSKPIADALSIARAAAVLVYLGIAVRTAYGGGWSLAMGRSVLLVFAYTVVVIIAFMTVAAVFLGWWVLEVRA